MVSTCKNVRRSIRALLQLWCFFLPLFCILNAYGGTAIAQTKTETMDEHPFRLAFSTSLFRDVNEADIRAAMKVWILTVAKDVGIEVDSDIHIYGNVSELRKFAENNPVDGFAITTPELVQLSSSFVFDRYALGTRRGDFRDEYLLLVRDNSGIETLEQLRDKDLVIWDSPRTSLAQIWLESTLLEKQLGRIDGYFSQVLLRVKPSQVALPVFFGKNTACLITRDSFDVMGELNPQLRMKLRVIAQSPPYVSAGFAFLQNRKWAFREKIFKAMQQLDGTAAGRQILALTQSDTIINYPIEILNESITLIARHQQLLEANLSQ